ncbi:hypothetical protein LV07_002168 [Salmonella enterica subsp. enterica serovar Javiana]|uniref:Uncharacterized protein n=1 Tax=Salmonella enterica subsp. enterica serovar Panama TaxID=29472 RepID=A0A735N1L8_SALET|nr:hypothetical protein [Salmonella enterica subsp. enterica serovar Javiana]EDQ7629559.1 hypothetical protein [Salmonella enterica]EDV8989702.1 hypothetical protein [Salmonella enterica subsp. enterica serovar Daytona]EEG5963823.1 hypothetical protein [Salmonella enterica subsp. enterica]HAE6965644.1 hypothetical protein [Salmonella enterica subsp. enterica serovar Panama]
MPTSHLNGLSLGCFRGGLIGWLAVDPFNGGMYTLKPKEANASLIPSTKQD